ncbi:MAG: hypothetical protein FVQ77_10120 [Cytophagales bacterium]|nr:hypothetical protein [Cytophagales bacterium]
MKTIILTIPEKRELWFRTLFRQFQIKHKVLNEEEQIDLMLAKLIDEAMAEEGEVSKEQIYKFIIQNTLQDKTAIRQKKRF